MRTKADEALHIKTFGERAFADVLAKTSMCVRMDARLTGCDKIREPLAYQAALEATGFERRAFTLGRKEIPADAMEIIADLLGKARAAGKP